MRARTIGEAQEAEPDIIVIGDAPDGTPIPKGTGEQRWFTAKDAEEVEVFGRGDVCGMPERAHT